MIKSCSCLQSDSKWSLFLETFKSFIYTYILEKHIYVLQKLLMAYTYMLSLK